MPSIDSEVPPAAVPKPNPRNNPVMFKIFQNVQYNVVQHKKYVKEMIKLYKKVMTTEFNYVLNIRIFTKLRTSLNYSQLPILTYWSYFSA